MIGFYLNYLQGRQPKVYTDQCVISQPKVYTGRDGVSQSVPHQSTSNHRRPSAERYSSGLIVSTGVDSISRKRLDVKQQVTDSRSTVTVRSGNNIHRQGISPQRIDNAARQSAAASHSDSKSRHRTDCAPVHMHSQRRRIVHVTEVWKSVYTLCKSRTILTSCMFYFVVHADCCFILWSYFLTVNVYRLQFMGFYTFYMFCIAYVILFSLSNELFRRWLLKHISSVSLKQNTYTMFSVLDHRACKRVLLQAHFMTK